MQRKFKSTCYNPVLEVIDTRGKEGPNLLHVIHIPEIAVYVFMTPQTTFRKESLSTVVTSENL